MYLLNFIYHDKSFHMISFSPSNLPDEIETLSLPHPRTGELNSFIIHDGIVYELICVDKHHSMFFVDNTVNSSNKVFIMAPINPLFIALPVIKEKALKKATINQIFTKSPVGCLTDLVSPLLESVCDKDGDKYIYNEEKTKQWLLNKVDTLMKHVRETNSETKDYKVMEIAFDILIHFLPKSIKIMLKKELKKKYPSAFAKVVEPESEKPKKGRKSKKPEPPKNNKSISSFFSAGQKK